MRNNNKIMIMTPTTTMAKTGGARRCATTQEAPWTSRLVPVVVMVLYGALLMAYHVHADRNESSQNTERDGAAPPTTAALVSACFHRILSGPEGWTGSDRILFWALIMVGFEILDFISKNMGIWTKRPLIPVRGKHLDELSSKDLLFVGLNKAATPPLVYFFLRYAYFEENVVWELSDMSLSNAVLPLPLLFTTFDFFYTIIHWFLHIKAIYGYIHKHHHHQKAPSRANVDAVNVHPVEYFLGEYDHLLSFVLCCQFLQIHVACAFCFMAVGGVLAGLNHTRYDFSWTILGRIHIYDSKAHDVHHRIPQSNYGQYTMFWDVVFGSFRPYDPNDRINPKAQLDPSTGKSYEFMETTKLAAKIE